MANRTKRTPQKDGKFLKALAEMPVGQAAMKAGYSRRSVYEYRETDPAFAQDWDDAVALYIEKLEQEADRRAFVGYEEPVWYQGEQCGTTRKYSDSLLMFRLKALAPDKYRERQQIDHSGTMSVTHSLQSILDEIDGTSAGLPKLPGSEDETG